VLLSRHGFMLYNTLSAAVDGTDANIIQVEVDCSGIKCDQDHFHTVGLPDAAVRESRDRVRAALKNRGYTSFTFSSNAR
jgi:magnesium chelatase family protein